ncbi:MAG TPA: hypothetical protein VM118_10075 [Acidobacteriota bacterium]|nr:hypothetical protein [Acidobacteriota bacterium]
MSRAETVIVRLVVGVSMIVLPTVALWWATAAIGMTFAPSLGDDVIKAATAVGFGIGILLLITRLRSWVGRFYTANITYMLLLYFAWSALVTTSLMGLPLGNLVTGTAAGFYVGRRHHHARQTRDVLRARARLIGFATAAVTGIWAVWIGILALREKIVAEVLQAALGMRPAALAGWPGIAMVLAASVLLCLIQYWCTLAAARLAHRQDGPAAAPHE